MVEDIKGEQLALEGVALVPHKGLQAVLAAAVGIAHMAGDALQVGVRAFSSSNASFSQHIFIVA